MCDQRLPKFCIFCGEKPDAKSKEHVIPLWLIALTGNPNRQAFFGFNGLGEKNIKIRKYAFDQFSFPACQKCNGEYADLEGITKRILLEVINDQPISAQSMTIFLDWLDKVRIGIWLGMNQLDKNFAGIKPKFFISQRLGTQDRMLIVEKSDSIRPKLNMGGVFSFLFSFTPAAFTLIVNNYFFTNISLPYLVARRLGFPYPVKSNIDPNSHIILSDFHSGLQRIIPPPLNYTRKDRGVAFYQPMFKGALMDSRKEIYQSEYVFNHSINYEKGTGNIFYAASPRTLKEYSSEDEISLTPKVIQSDNELYLESAIRVTELQIWLSKNLTPSFELFDKEERKYHLGIKKDIENSAKFWIDYLRSHRDIFRKQI